MYKIRLSKIFRQADPVDGMIFNRIRTGTQTDYDLGILAARVHKPASNAVILTPFRASARKHNESKLREIPTEEYQFHCQETGTFKGKEAPFPKILKLKEGCRVLIKSNSKEHVNGDTGMFLGVDKNDRLIVHLDRNGEVIRIKKKKSSHCSFFAEQTIEGGVKLKEKEIGKFVQYPVQLGYAMTIHSSQGSTMQRIHLELPNGPTKIMDSPGLIYVAISRVPSISRLTLSRPIRHTDVLSIVNDAEECEEYQQFDLTL